MRQIFLSLLFCSMALSVWSQARIKVMHYNLLELGQSCGTVTASDKFQWLGAILESYQPDIFTVNEISPNASYANGIQQVSFDYTNAISYSDFTNQAASNIVNLLFYNDELFGYAGVSVIANSLRDINVYKLYLQPAFSQSSDTTFLHCIVAHLKAGSSSSDEQLRSQAANSIQSWLSANAAGKNILLLGDLNIYNHLEPAFQTLVVQGEAHLQDPINLTSGWNGATFTQWHTQSTRSSAGACGSGGGMDDRFDFILANDAIMNGSLGVQYVPDSYKSYGNNGNSYNSELSCVNSPVSSNVCASLKLMSDHLPVVLELDLANAVKLDPLTQIPDLDVEVQYHSDRWELHLTQNQSSTQYLQMELMNLLGGQVLVKKIESSGAYLIDFQSLPKGVYLLRLQDSQHRQWQSRLLRM